MNNNHLDADNQRKRDLAKIHVAKKQLGMDDDTYRMMLQEVASVNSAKSLSAMGRATVLAHLKSCGMKFKTPPKSSTKTRHPGKPHNMKPQLDKIEALLTDMTLSWNYANSLAQHMFKVDRVSWLKTSQQLGAIIAALTYEQEKRALLANIESMVDQLKLDWQEVESWIPTSKRKNWKRSTAALKQVKARLLNSKVEA